DAALDWAEDTGNETIGIVEGVLDAARFGPPFVSIMGMSMSSNQGALAKNFFRRAILVPDNDADSSKREKFLADAKDVLSGLEIIEGLLPKGVKDAGDLSVEKTKELRNKWNLK
ncbi:toprim domain-containing protein, partial [Arthrospira platensis SPKY1]|nr:toprim domain-containing protein [Arthrospira platensis SPKY1]